MSRIPNAASAFTKDRSQGFLGIPSPRARGPGAFLSMLPLPFFCQIAANWFSEPGITTVRVGISGEIRMYLKLASALCFLRLATGTCEKCMAVFGSQLQLWSAASSSCHGSIGICNM